MNKLIALTAVAVAATGLAAAPAVAGLTHNPSFSHQLPVRVPSDAQSVQVGDDHSLTVHEARSPGSSSVSPSAIPSAEPTSSRHVEPGDDRGGATTASTTRSPEPGDDNGGRSGGSDGSGGSGSSGGSGRGGSDDGPGHS